MSRANVASPNERSEWFKRLVMRFIMCGKYTVEPLGEWWVVRKHGLFTDRLVNLLAPHMTESLKGGPYFSRALGTERKAKDIWARLNGMNGYGA